MIKTMVPRGFVEEYREHPKKFYRLTDKGEELAKRMHLEQVDPTSRIHPPTDASLFAHE